MDAGMARHAHDLGRGECAAAPAAVLEVAPGQRPDIGSRARPGKVAERSCIVTRAALPTDRLIRFVLSPQGVVTPDIARALPGRGVWVTASRGRIAEACRRNAFARAFKKEVTTPSGLADDVGLLLRKHALQALSLANKAAALTSGFEKTRAALESGEALALIEASEASPEGRNKLISAWRRGGGAASEFAILDCFASLELDLALGRPHVIHAALLRAPAGGFALARCLRLHRFELVEKHASGSAEHCGAARESRNSKRQSEPPSPSIGTRTGELSRRTAGQKSV
jgi:predicted RNA-binding protein YlxR (DUF448 family)